MAEPLRKLTRKNEPFVFGGEQKEAFRKLKQLLASSKTLGYYDPEAETSAIADASPVGLGAVLVQKQKGEPRIICYASRSLSDVERRYLQTEREALALVWACEKFHAYIYGLEFHLLTDHKPLEVIYSSRSKPCARIERWVLRMQPYKFKVDYIPGKANIADALSRLLKPNSIDKIEFVEDNVMDRYARFVAVNATPKAMTAQEVEEESADDRELAEVRKCIESGNWDDTPNKICSSQQGTVHSRVVP